MPKSITPNSITREPKLTEGQKIKDNKVRKLDPNIIRVGDYIRIIKPDMFIRCGYPLSKKEARDEVEKLFSGEVLNLIHSVSHGDTMLTAPFSLSDTSNFVDNRIYGEIMDALAYKRLQYKKFGGNERSIHTENKPDLMNAKANVSGIKFVQTGFYVNGSSGYTYEGEWDGSPPYLEDNKSHKILEITWIRGRYWNEDRSDFIKFDTIEPLYTNNLIEAINVKKITKEEYDSDDKITNPTTIGS